MPKLVSLQLLHEVKVIKDWLIISVDESWTLRHVFERLADGTEDEGDSWVLDATLRTLPLVCKVGSSRKGDFQQIILSVSVEDVLEFGKYFQFILQGGGNFAARKLSWLEKEQLKAALSDYWYTCDSSLQDLLLTIEEGVRNTHVLDKVYVRNNMTFNEHIEVSY